MEWNQGFSAAYYAAVVDVNTWRDIERIEITDGSVSRTSSGLRGAADIGCVNYEQGHERWIRIWLIAKQAGETAHTPLFTGLACSPERSINGTLITNAVQLYSVLKPAEDVLLGRGWYAPAGTSGRTLINTLLEVTPAPVVYEDNIPSITENIVAEDNENHLTMVEKILTAINWRLRISGDGTIYVAPKASEESAMYDALENDAVEPEIDVTNDWYSAPNVFRAVSGDAVEVVYDESKNPMSVPSRGREVWMEESACNFNDGESLYDYARRRLAEEQQTAVRVKYRRRYNPDILPGDLVRLNYPRQAVTGVYLVDSQSIELGHGAATAEEGVKYGE